MIKENKDLLLKYLCAALPYGVIIEYNNDGCSLTREMGIGSLHDFMYDNAELKPYLRPMSSMPEEEKELLKKEHVKDEKLYLDAINGDGSMRGKVILHYAADWCNKNHFDYRGLIQKGLAIEVTESNNPYKE